jgi:hypothetical protein
MKVTYRLHTKESPNSSLNPIKKILICKRIKIIWSHSHHIRERATVHSHRLPYIYWSQVELLKALLIRVLEVTHISINFNKRRINSHYFRNHNISLLIILRIHISSRISNSIYMERRGLGNRKTVNKKGRLIRIRVLSRFNPFISDY